MSRRIAIVGGGVSGLGVAYALHRQPDKFDFRLFEAQPQIGGNAITADMPQEDGSSVPFDISVTACIPSVYHHIMLLAKRYGIDIVPTRFSYSVKYRGEIYAHDLDSEIGRALQPEIEKFQRLLKRLQWFGRLNWTRSKLLNALNPFNYLSMGAVLNFGRFSGDFRYKVLKPMFVNFLMATNVFDMPASLFCRYLEFFDIVSATPMRTWEGGTRRLYEKLSADFRGGSVSNPVRGGSGCDSRPATPARSGVATAAPRSSRSCAADAGAGPATGNADRSPRNGRPPPVPTARTAPPPAGSPASSNATGAAGSDVAGNLWWISPPQLPPAAPAAPKRRASSAPSRSPA